MKKDLISIIVPTLNASSTIKSTLKSVLNQTIKNWEVIIIDGYSTDRTISIIKKFNNKKFKIYSLHKKKGLAEARYTGIKKSKGNYIAFLDADDLWNRNKLKYQLNFMKSKQIKFSATKFSILSKTSKFISDSNIERINYDYFLYNRPICNSSVLIEKKLILNIARKHRYNIYAEDYLWWLEVMKKKVDCYLIKENLTNIRLSNDNRSKNFIKNFKDLYFIYKKINKLSYFKIIKIYLFLVKNSFNKIIFKIRAIYLNY